MVGVKETVLRNCLLADSGTLELRAMTDVLSSDREGVEVERKNGRRLSSC